MGLGRVHCTRCVGGGLGAAESSRSSCSAHDWACCYRIGRSGSGRARDCGALGWRQRSQPTLFDVVRCTRHVCGSPDGRDARKADLVGDFASKFTSLTSFRAKREQNTWQGLVPLPGLPAPTPLHPVGYENTPYFTLGRYSQPTQRNHRSHSGVRHKCSGRNSESVIRRGKVRRTRA